MLWFAGGAVMSMQMGMRSKEGMKEYERVMSKVLSLSYRDVMDKIFDILGMI
jgi:hypothetical protein